MPLNIDSTLNRDPVPSRLGGDLTTTGDISITGGDMTSTATTFNLLNATVTTLNIGGAATAISIGAATGTLTINNPTVVAALLYGSTAANGDLTLEGTSHATKTSSYVILQPTGGNVGIGTTGPLALLHLNSVGANPGIRIQQNSANYADIHTDSGGNLFFRADQGFGAESTYTAFFNDGSEKVRIDSNGNVGIGAASPATLLELENVTTITGAVTDGYSAALTLDPGYTAATAQTVTRHNYIDVNNVSVAGAGPAAVTDAAVLRFDAAVGTHKATVAASTKTTPTGVDGWIKMNVNGTLMYVPMYLSTTA